MKRYLYIIVLVLLQASLFAQPEGGERPAMPREAANTTGGVVKGYVTDDNAKPLEYALVYVLKASDSTVVTGVTSQKDGNFLIEQVPFGDFLLKVESMGYKEQYTAPFTLTASLLTVSVPLSCTICALST